MSDTTQTFQEVIARLSEPMEIRWRVKSFYKEGVDKQQLKIGRLPQGTKGQFLPYIDARDVFDRLDKVAGPGNWNDNFEIVEGTTVKTTIEVTINGQTKRASDVGYPGREKDAQPLKAAVSDGIKRAAVHFGIGRFLYATDPIWVEVDKFGRPLQPIQSNMSGKQQVDTPTTIASPTAAPRQSTQAPSAPVDTKHPSSTATSKPGDIPCEVPGCKNDVWASREERTRHYHKGHVICYFHSKNGDWEAALAKKTNVDPDTGEYLDKPIEEHSEAEMADLMNTDPGSIHTQDVNPEDIPF